MAREGLKLVRSEANLNGSLLESYTHHKALDIAFKLFNPQMEIPSFAVRNIENAHIFLQGTGSMLGETRQPKAADLPCYF